MLAQVCSVGECVKRTCACYSLFYKWHKYAALRRSWQHSRVGKGITAQASHRSVREFLNSYGSCYSITSIYLTTNEQRDFCFAA